MFSCNLLVCKLKLCDGIIMSFILYKINIAWSKYCSYLDIEDITNVMIHSVLYTFQGLLPPSLYCSCLPRVAVKKGKNDFEKILMPESSIMPCHGTLLRKAGATFGRCPPPPVTTHRQKEQCYVSISNDRRWHTTQI